MQEGGRQEYLNHVQDPRQTPPQIPDFQGAENHHQLPPSQKCLCCDSFNTTFCYYNNYSLSQRRYFCKACRRYWTHGGTLRNVPIGGSCLKANSRNLHLHLHQTVKWPEVQSFINPTSSQNLISTGVISGQSLMRTSPPVNIPLLRNISFYPAGGAVQTSLAVMQPLPKGVNQVMAPVSFGGSGQFSGNMILTQGMNLQSLKHPASQQIQAQNRLFPSLQSLILQRPEFLDSNLYNQRFHLPFFRDKLWFLERAAVRVDALVTLLGIGFFVSKMQRKF